MLAAARYGHVEVLREVISKYGCDKNAVKEVCCNVLLSKYAVMSACSCSCTHLAISHLECV